MKNLPCENENFFKNLQRWSALGHSGKRRSAFGQSKEKPVSTLISSITIHTEFGGIVIRVDRPPESPIYPITIPPNSVSMVKQSFRLG